VQSDSKASETLTLGQAAAFLKMSSEALRRKAKLGEIPGVKAGKRWCFYKPDLVAYLRSRYAFPWQAS
jgi:excisionase family DNA binding protein